MIFVVNDENVNDVLTLKVPVIKICKCDLCK